MQQRRQVRGRGDARCKEGDAVKARCRRGEKEDVRGRKGSVSKGKKKKEKTNKLTAESRAPRRKAQCMWIKEKGGPPSERGSQFTCDGKGAVQTNL